MPLPSRSRKDLEVREAPASPDATTIPQEVVDYFADKGARLSWGARYDTTVAKAAINHQRFPVNVSVDIEDENVRKKLTETLRRFGSRITEDGNVHRADCLLYQQATAAWEQDEKEAMERFLLHNSNAEREAFADQLTERIARETGDSNLAHVRIADSRRYVAR